MQIASREAVERLRHERRAEFREPVMQLSGRHVRADRRARRDRHRARVEPGVHLHDIDAALPVAGHDGALDRRGAPPARQKRAVQVETAQHRGFQNGLGQKQAIGHDYRGIEIEGWRLLAKSGGRSGTWKR